MCFQLYGLLHPPIVIIKVWLHIRKLRKPTAKLYSKTSMSEVWPGRIKALQPLTGGLSWRGSIYNDKEEKTLPDFFWRKVSFINRLLALNLTRCFLGQLGHSTCFQGLDLHTDLCGHRITHLAFHPAPVTSFFFFFFFFLFFLVLARLSSSSLNHPWVSGKGFWSPLYTPVFFPKGHEMFIM